MLHTCPILTVALAQVQCIILSKYNIDRLRSARVAGDEKPNMIITVICDVLGDENNGTTIACMNLIRGLKKRGHTVRVVCMDKDKMGREGYYIVRASTARRRISPLISDSRTLRSQTSWRITATIRAYTASRTAYITRRNSYAMCLRASQGAALTAS